MQSNVLAQFWIPTNTPSSKNNRRWTGKFFIVSKSTMKWRKETKGAWMQQKKAFQDVLRTLTKPYVIEFTFVRKSVHRFDYVNIAQAPLDAMTEYGWLEDDNADNVVPYFGDYIYDKKNPGLKITILKNKPNHYADKTFSGTDQ